MAGFTHVFKDWRSCPDRKEKYQLYLASREWAILKEAVRDRSGGTCEYCRLAPGTQTHHQTYKRIFCESLEDLMHVCEPCHMFLSGRTKVDPRHAVPRCDFTEFLKSLDSLGIRLYLGPDGRLLCDGPPGIFTSEVQDRLRHYKPRIMAMFAAGNFIGPLVRLPDPSPPGDRPSIAPPWELRSISDAWARWASSLPPELSTKLGVLRPKALVGPSSIVIESLPNYTWVAEACRRPELLGKIEAAIGRWLGRSVQVVFDLPPGILPAPVIPTHPLAPTRLFEGPESFEVVPESERPSRVSAIQAEAFPCVKCSQLASCRKSVVFGEGSLTARLMFIGEAPGSTEDETGRPFVGRAGLLLVDIIVRGMGISRSQVYLANVLKCRPPENRPPTPDEVVNCLPFLHRQIAVVRPEFLCLLGKTAASSVLETALPMGKLRGKWHRYRGIPTIVTYHPSALLRNPAWKVDAWEDFGVLMQAMGLGNPSRIFPFEGGA